MKLISTKELMSLSFLLFLPILLFSMEKSESRDFSNNKKKSPKSEVSFSLSLTEVHPSCTTCMDGSISTSIVGGVAPFTYVWSNGASTSSINNLGNGTYTVSVTDFFGFQKIESVTLIAIGVEVSTLDVACYGDSTGNAVAIATGVLPIQYLWSNGNTTSTSSNLPQGNYSITVTDATGATASENFTITSPDSLVVMVDITVGCEGGNSGSATAIVTGGSFPYSYAWSNGNTLQISTNLSTGNYVVTVTDNNGCQVISNVVFLNQPIEVNSNPFPSSTSCAGGMDGSVTLDVWGGTGSYTFDWSHGATTQNISNLSAGSYTVTVTDTNGCTSTSEVTVDSPAPISLNVQGIGNVSCNGGSDGSIFADAFGGTPGYTYVWNNGATGSFIDSLEAGTYSATITDAVGCTGVGSVTVNEPEILETFTFGSSVCNGSDDGTANVVVSGGTQPYFYAWSTGATTPEIENLSIGTYYVTVNDVNQCIAEDSITINLNANILVSNPSSTMVSCSGGNDGTATITPTGGNEPYTYMWSTGSIDSIISNLMVGTYTVTVVDFFNCSFVETYDITQPSPVEINATTVNTNCGMQNGIIYLNPTGGTPPYTFEWSNGTTADSLANLDAGAYAVNVTDANGCIKQFFVDVMMGNNPPIAITQNISISLNDLGLATIDAAQINNGSSDDCGIDTMFIDLNSFDCSNLGENTVTLTVLDEDGVSANATATVTVLDDMPPMVLTQNITLTLDQNGIAVLTIDQINNGSSDNCGIDSMSIDISQFDCSNIGNNSVMLTILDINGNVDSAEATVTIIDDLPPTIITQNLTIYLNDMGMAQVDMNQIDNGSSDNCGIDSMSINISQFDCSNIGNNSVMLTVLDANGNADSAEAIITIIDSLPPTINTQNLTIYLNDMGMAQIDINQIDNGSSDNCGIDSMSINISQFDCSNIGNNSVMLTVLDASGNADSAEVIITIIDSLPPTINTQNLTIYLDEMGIAEIDMNQIDNGSSDNCGIDSISINITQFDCSNIGDNSVMLTVLDASGNMDSAEVIITIIDSLPPTINTQNLTIYLDEMGMAQIDLNQVDNGSSDNCGIDSMSIDITQFDCSTIGENTVTLTMIDASGNMQSDTAIITVVDTIPATFSCPSDLLIASCDSTIIIDYTLGAVMDNCSTGDPILVSGIPSGGEVSTGTVTNIYEYIDQGGNVTTCSFDITLETSAAIEIQLDSFTPATDGNSDGSIEISITSGIGPFQFEWISNGNVVSTDEDPTGLPAGNYEVSVTSADGCVATFQVEITTGIQDLELVEKVNLFPNPTSDILFVKMDLPIQSGDKIQLYSIDGKVLLEKILNDGDELVEMNITNFTNGIYIMQLTVNQGIVTKRVVVD